MNKKSSDAKRLKAELRAQLNGAKDASRIDAEPTVTNAQRQVPPPPPRRRPRGTTVRWIVFE